MKKQKPSNEWPNISTGASTRQPAAIGDQSITAFTDWKGKRRKFSLADSIQDARDKLGELRTMNKGRYDWDIEKKKKAVRGMTLFTWIERFEQVKASAEFELVGPCTTTSLSSLRHDSTHRPGFGLKHKWP